MQITEPFELVFILLKMRQSRPYSVFTLAFNLSKGGISKLIFILFSYYYFNCMLESFTRS